MTASFVVAARTSLLLLPLDLQVQTQYLRYDPRGVEGKLQGCEIIRHEATIIGVESFLLGL